MYGGRVSDCSGDENHENENNKKKGVADKRAALVVRQQTNNSRQLHDVAAAATADRAGQADVGTQLAAPCDSVRHPSPRAATAPYGGPTGEKGTARRKKKRICLEWGSNPRPSDYETNATTNCAIKASMIAMKCFKRI